MLFLTRSTNSALSATVMVGDDIEVLSHKVCGDQIRIGIKAPSEITVDRNEIVVIKKSAPPSNQSPRK